MPFSKREQTILADLEKAKSTFPDVVEILTFYERIFRVQFALKCRLEKEEGPDTGRKGKSIFKPWKTDPRKFVSKNWACNSPFF